MAASATFTPEAKKEAEELVGKYPDKMAALIPVLHIAQREFGHISPEAEALVADMLGLSKTHVHGVVTFYTMFLVKPPGKYLLQLCTNLSCTLNGAESLLEHVQKKLGVGNGETTPDGRFTLLTVECLGSCDTGPVIQINDDYHENLTREKVDEILDGLK